MLGNDRVKDELELVDDQIEAIQALQSEQRSSMQEMFSSLRDRFRDMDPSEREEVMSEIREEIAESNKEFEKRLYEELLPHQSRPTQAAWCSRRRADGGVVITSGQVSESVADELGITDEQMEKMRAKGG
jgi:hypothetical protein